MHIFLITDSKTGINFFPKLEVLLRKRIADLELETVFVPFPEDVPAAVSSVEKEADLVFVFVLYEELNFKIKALLDKLIEVDMRSKTKVVKVVEESEYGNLDSLRLEQEKERLAEKWSEFILNLLFKKHGFKPKEPTDLEGNFL